MFNTLGGRGFLEQSPRRTRQHQVKYSVSPRAKESKQDMAFRLSFSPIRKQEHSIHQALSTFEKPFSTLEMPNELRTQFNGNTSRLRQIFSLIEEDKSNTQNINSFWSEWKQFDTVLHEISKHSAYYYITLFIHKRMKLLKGLINAMKSNAPSLQPMQQEFIAKQDQLISNLNSLYERFEEIFASENDELRKIRDLESMRNQIRLVRAELSNEMLPFFTLSTLSRVSQDQYKQKMESLFEEMVTAISNLKRQTYLLDCLDSEIENTVVFIEMMIHGTPTQGTRSSRIQDIYRGENQNENWIANQAMPKDLIRPRQPTNSRRTRSPNSRSLAKLSHNQDQFSTETSDNTDLFSENSADELLTDSFVSNDEDFIVETNTNKSPEINEAEQESSESAQFSDVETNLEDENQSLLDEDEIKEDNHSSLSFAMVETISIESLNKNSLSFSMIQSQSVLNSTRSELVISNANLVFEQTQRNETYTNKYLVFLIVWALVLLLIQWTKNVFNA